MKTPIQYATPYDRARCLYHMQQNLDLAATCAKSPGDIFCRETRREAMARAKMWKRHADKGGNATYHYQVRHGILPVSYKFIAPHAA